MTAALPSRGVFLLGAISVSLALAYLLLPNTTASSSSASGRLLDEIDSARDLLSSSGYFALVRDPPTWQATSHEPDLSVIRKVRPV
jgi:hypothetical protein